MTSAFSFLCFRPLKPLPGRFRLHVVLCSHLVRGRLLQPFSMGQNSFILIWLVFSTISRLCKAILRSVFNVTDCSSEEVARHFAELKFLAHRSPLHKLSSS